MGKEPILFIVSAPSGAGKTSLCREVLAHIPGLRFSISYTTRPPRHKEISGVDYNFISLEEFQKMIEADQLVEWTEIYGNFYGTSRLSVEECRDKGIDIIFDIDPVGARSIKEAYNDSITIFVLPPSYKELEERLTQRGTDNKAVIKNRLDKARDEIEQSSWYQYQIVNDDFKDAVGQLKGIIDSERLKRKRK